MCARLLLLGNGTVVSESCCCGDSTIDRTVLFPEVDCTCVIQGTAGRLELQISQLAVRMPKAPHNKGKQEKKVIHPYSRKAAQLSTRRSINRTERKEKLKNEKAIKLSIIGEKLQWFQSHLDPNKSEFTKNETCDLIESYLHRFDSELEQIELHNSIKGRQARQHGSRETVIKQTIERERRLYNGYGMEIPDIVNSKHLKTFREWDLDLKKLPNIKMRKFSVSDSLPKSEKDLSAKDDKEEENLENEEKSSLESDSGSE
ncbi:translation machinery-associated protein 16 [Rana temporaria]|uniref:translation machinery-associated protein 16 n=1 Tax=Rana temporaria TaxID=8407 RepID=UPI001AAD889E|nr:translation machinery-associated protein 16 [Rana temporaria]